MRCSVFPPGLDPPPAQHHCDESIRASDLLQSAKILQRQSARRDQIKQQLRESRCQYLSKMARSREDRIHRWITRTRRSPYTFDNLADEQRIGEENQVRLREERKQQKVAQKRREKLRQEIVMKALGEVSDLEVLRREKRAIMDEEKRLRALLDLEKSRLHTKEDYMAAIRAEKHRRHANEDLARQERLRLAAEERKEECRILREYLDVPVPSDHTFGSSA